MGLEAGRVEEMVAGAVAAESCIPCHAHLYVGAGVEPVCAGFARRHATLPIRLAVAMGVVEWVDG